MKAHVDRDVCIGCGLCTQTCPEVFQLEDDLSTAYQMPTKETIDSAKEAEEGCPVSAISVEA